ncbi:putative choline ethanolamine kinase [Rosellinia necatrix]|uniref:ethanolamine kinase n=1 Tax=Rosellinia necatrix TaxID=77044 RepID=A0A1W2TPW9_ROSNE|nr:putative choline ethanolamine kinase [Rosellinia necatrix]
MPSNAPNGVANGDSTDQILRIPWMYDSTNDDDSARKLILALRPEWSSPDSKVEFVRFTDGITNTLLKAVNRKPGLSREQVDSEAILLRAYGHGTDVIIDRLRETQNHELLMKHGLAPTLLARFGNGMMYRYIQGKPCQPADLREPSIYLAVSRRIAQWHATVPCIHEAEPKSNGVVNGSHGSSLESVAPGKPVPNTWTVMQKWIRALPTKTEAQRARQSELQKELSWLVEELSQRPGLGKNGLVFAHCDLLSGNVIIEPKGPGTNGVGSKHEGQVQQPSVSFIDYEYATPSPAAFDLANHFAEWGGFDCDYSVLPTRAQRLEFIREYIHTYFSLVERPEGEGEVDEEAEAQRLHAEVDTFRGVPGFYWGIWALIQATISHIDFDYAQYAEVRLGEYWAWREEMNGSREAAGKEAPPREKRWAQ